MTGAEGDPQPLTQESRTRVIEALSEQFADDRLTLEEFEARLDLAHRARTQEDLNSLVPARAPVPTVSGPALPPARRVGLESVKERSLVLGFWGGSRRAGTWIPAKKNYVVAFQGGAELDLREARFGPGVTTINVLCAMGGVSIIVPPDLQVDFGGVGIMGGFDLEGDARAPTDETAPLVRIRGLAVWGGAGVEVRHIGETVAEARQRRRLRKRMRKELPPSSGDPTT